VDALNGLVAWLAKQQFHDAKGLLPPGLRIQYHSRSDEHSKQLGELIVQDLLDTCPLLAEHAAAGRTVYGINLPHVWSNGKVKTLDVAIGTPLAKRTSNFGARIDKVTGGRNSTSLARLLVAIEEKATMTEHSKAQPRMFSELNDAHTIIHQGDRWTISGGIEMLNISPTFISPLRQRPDQALDITQHNQPQVTRNMVQHLRKLPQRDEVGDVGLDAYCTFVINLDNQGHVSLHEGPPAPQPGDIDHYQTFLQRICRFYTERFAYLDKLPSVEALSVEDALAKVSRDYRGLLPQVGQLAVDAGLPGAAELDAVLLGVEVQQHGEPPEVEEEA